MATISEMMVKIGADNEDLKSGLQEAGSQTEGLGKKAGGMGKKVAKGTAVAGAAVAGLGAATFAMVENVTSGFDDIAKGAERLGVSTDAYQEMEYWASQNGISHQQMEKTVGRFNQRMGKAQNGNEKYADALEKLNVNMDDVRDGTVSTEDAFSQSIKTLSEMENEQDKVNLATEMFGDKTARDLLPALNDGSLSMDEAAEKANELGLVVEEDALKAGEKFQDTWDDLKRVLGTFGQQIATDLMPIMQSFMEWIVEKLPAIRETFGTVFEAIGTVLGGFKDVIMTIIETVQQWFEGNSETMTQLQEMFQEKLGQIKETIMSIWTTIKEFWDENGQAILDNAREKFTIIKETITEIITAVWEIIQSYLNTIKEFWEENGEELMNSAMQTFQTIEETVMTALESVQNIIEQVLGLIVPFLQKQLEKIQKFWAENGEQIMAAVENAFSFIQGVIEFVMPIVQGIISSAWIAIEGIIDGATSVVMGIIQTFSSLLTGDFEGIKEGLLSIWEGLWSAIEGVVSGAWDLLSGAFSSLFGNLSDWFTGLKDDAIGWGGDLLTGFWEGIKGMGGTIKRKIGGLIEDIVPGPIKSVLGISSPSKLMKEFGQDTGEGFAIGMDDMEHRISKSSEQMANSAIPDKEPNAGSQNFDFGRIFEGANISIRDERDIEEIARRLGQHVKNTQRKQGVVVR